MSHVNCKFCHGTGKCHLCKGLGYKQPEPISNQNVTYATGVGNASPSSVSTPTPMFKPVGIDEKLPICTQCKGKKICIYCNGTGIEE